MKRIRYIYSERCQSSSCKDITAYPDTCPICGAVIKEDKRDYYDGPIYECGGQYTFKPQIQNHTDKWWGSCPIKKEEARKVQGRECKGCGEKRLEGTGFPIDLFGWTCKACDYRNPPEPKEFLAVS